MLVAVHASSMNTRRSGARLSWPSNHSSRSLTTSDRSRSMAWPVLSGAHAVPRQEAIKPRHRDVPPSSIRLARSSSSERSLRTSHTATMSARRSSTRRELMSPPYARGIGFLGFRSSGSWALRQRRSYSSAHTGIGHAADVGSSTANHPSHTSHLLHFRVCWGFLSWLSHFARSGMNARLYLASDYLAGRRPG